MTREFLAGSLVALAISLIAMESKAKDLTESDVNVVRSLKKIRLIVRESYGSVVIGVAGKDAKRSDPRYREYLRALLEKCGPTATAPDATEADATLTADIELIAQGMEYRLATKRGTDETKTLYTGWFLKGTVLLEVPGRTLFLDTFQRNKDPEDSVLFSGGIPSSFLSPHGIWDGPVGPQACLASALELLSQAYGLKSLMELPGQDATGRSQDWLETALKAHFKEQGKRAVEPALTALKHSDALIRARAAEVLGGTIDLRAVEPLSRAHADPDPSVRLAAIRALLRILGETDCPRDVDWLLYGLSHNDPRTRAFAAKGLQRKSDPRAIGPLIDVLNNEPDFLFVDFGTRGNAATALAKITGQNFGEDAAKWQTWWEGEKGRQPSVRGIGESPTQQRPMAPIDAGDTIVTITKNAPLMDAGKMLLTLESGTELVALETRGDWILVTVQGRGEKTTGWLHREHAAAK